jgi:tyrosinase
MAGNLRNRPGVQNLSDAEVGAFRDAYAKMQAITDNRSFTYFAGLHGDPNYFCQHTTDVNAPAYLFLPWHRAYLYNFELAMRSQVPTATLPWWDWTLRPPRQDGIPKIFAAKTVAGGKANPLYSYRIDADNPPVHHQTTRQPQPVDQLPTDSKVKSISDTGDWGDFSLNLEVQIHNAVHGWVGGDMGIVAYAAFDPIFYSHHCNIDRLWWLWQVRNGNGSMPDSLLDEVLVPWKLTVRDVLSVNSLGYDYAAAQAIVPI